MASAWAQRSFLKPNSVQQCLGTEHRRCLSLLVNGKPSSPPSKTGILLMNMGGPNHLDEVYPFLHRLFSDRQLIQLPFQRHLAPLLAKRRTPKIQQQYAAIGGKSPIRMWTEKQGAAMASLLDEMSPETAPHEAFTAFRYAAPLTDEAIREMKKRGIRRAVAFSQYPQYSCATTGSSLMELHRQLTLLDPERSIQWSILDRWPIHQGLIQAFVQRIQDVLEQYPEEEQRKFVVLFSAHSLPMSAVLRGDPYVHEVAATVHQIMQHVSVPFRLAWQSKVGPVQWMGPSTESVLRGLLAKRHRHVLLVPVAFTSDHIETLYELDLELVQHARAHGMTHLHRAVSLNDSALFIRAMADAVAHHLRASPAVCPKWMLTCPHCTQPTCSQTREYFANFRNTDAPPLAPAPVLAPASVEAANAQLPIISSIGSGF